MASINGQPLSWEATIENGDFNRKITDMERRLTGFTQTANTQSSAMESFAQKAAAAAAGYLTLQGAAGFVQSMVRVRGEFQQLEIAYRTMLKSKEAGDKLMADTVKLAATTPFELKEVATGAKQLLAYGFAAKDITANLEMLGNVAAGVSAPLQEVAYVYGTLKTQGRAYARDIQQFTGRGIPIIKELATVLGVAESEVMKLVEAGKVGFPEVEKAFQNMTGSSGMFFNLMKEQSASLTGQLSNLSDSWAIMLNEIGQSNEGLFSDAIRGASTLVENYDKVITVLKGLIAMYGAYRAAMMLQVVHLRVLQEMQLQVALSGRALTASQALQAAGARSLSVAQAALNRVMMANPYGMAAVAIGGLITAYMTFKEETLEVKSAQELMADSVQDINSELGKQRGEVESLVKVIQAQGAAESVRLEAYNKLKEIAPDILKGLTLEEAATAKLTERVDEYVRALRKKLSITSYQEKYQESIEQQIKAEDELTKAIQRRENAKQTVAIFKRDGGLGTDAGVRAVNEATRAEEAVREAYNRLEKAKDTSEHINQLIEGVYAKGTRDFLEQEIAALEKTRQAFDELSPEYAKIEEQIAEKRKQLESIAQGDKKKYEPKNREYFEKIIADNQKDLNALDKSAKDFKTQSEIYKKRILDAQKNLEAFDVKADRKASKDYEKLGEQRLAFLEQLTEKEAEIKRKGLTQNQQEIAEAQAKYAQLRKEADELRLGKGVKQRINRLEQEETGTIVYRQDTESLSETLSKQKQLYREYEEYKNIFGEQKAKERFQRELDLSKTYLQRLEGEYAQFDGVQPDSMDETERQRKEMLTKLLTEERKEQQEHYAELTKQLQDYEQQRLLLTEKYQRERESLLLEGDLQAVAELDSRFKSQLDKLNDEQAMKAQAIKDLFAGVDDLSLQQARKVVALAEQKLKELVEQGKISKEMAKEIEKLLKNTTTAINTRVPQSIARMADALHNLASAVGTVDEGFGKMLNTVGSVLGNVANIQTSLEGMKDGFAKGGVEGIMSGVTSYIGMATAAFSVMQEVVGFFDNTAETQARRDRQAAEQQAAQLAQIEAMTKAMERQLALIDEIYGAERLTAYADSLDEIEKKYKEQADSLKGIYKLTGNSVYDDVIKKVNAGQKLGTLDMNAWKVMQQQGVLETIDHLVDGLGKVGENTKSLEELQELLDKGLLDETSAAAVESLIKLGEQYKETFQKLRAELTGTSFESITDEIVSMFEQGNLAAADFAQNFEALMKKAILNSFKRNALEKELQKFYEEFAEAAESGGSLDKAEIEELRKLYNTIITNAGDQFKELEKLTGISFGDGTAANEQTGLAGAIRGITEEQADLLAGNFGAMRLHLAELVGMKRQELGLGKDTSFLQQQQYSLQEQTRLAIQNLAIQQRIEFNTAQLVISNAQALERLDRQLAFQSEQARSLRSLDQKTVNWDSALRMNGWKI